MSASGLVAQKAEQSQDSLTSLRRFLALVPLVRNIG